MRLCRLMGAGILALATANASAQAQEVTDYRYDALGRLTRTTVTGNSTSNVNVEYALDAAGNRTSVTVSTSTPTPTPACSIDVADYGFRLVKYGAPYSGSSRVLVSAPGCSSPVTLSYSTESGSAISGLHFAAGSGTLTIQPGQSAGLYPLNSMSIFGEEYLEFYVNFSIVSGSATLNRTKQLIFLAAD